MFATDAAIYLTQLLFSYTQISNNVILLIVYRLLMFVFLVISYSYTNKDESLENS